MHKQTQQGGVEGPEVMPDKGEKERSCPEQDYMHQIHAKLSTLPTHPSKSLKQAHQITKIQSPQRELNKAR